MDKTQKKEFVKDIKNQVAGISTVIITHYHGLSVSQMTELRNIMRESGANYKVLKNKLAKLIVTDTDLEPIKDMFSGPTAIAYSEDPIAAAKGIMKFAKTNEHLKILGGIVENKVIDEAGVIELSKAPSLDEIRAKIVGILNTPARNLLGVLSAPAGNLARVINAYSAK